MRQRENIYDLVARQSARHGMPREQLLELAFEAIVRNELQVSLPEDAPLDARLHGTVTWRDLIADGRRAVGHNPQFFVHWFRTITVDTTHFRRWLATEHRRPRGPERGTTGYRDADRKVFSQICGLIDAGTARSPYGAALILARDGKLAGKGAEPESQAKRVAARYCKERGRAR